MRPYTAVNNNYLSLTLSFNNANQLQIRSMREIDIDTVTQIDHETWRESSWFSEDFFKALHDPLWKCWILESTTKDNSILGYGLQYLLRGTSNIANLCIHPDQRGRGLGGILLRHMINYSREIGASIVELQVNTSNMHAYHLYVKHGFRAIEFLERYYSDTQNAYLMQLLLDRID
jgi:ribosomal-protein-alanine N-acetyltransferase